MAKKIDKAQPIEKTVEQRLIELTNLQTAYSALDRIKTLRGELPEEVKDLEDEIAGMQTRLSNLEEENKKQNQASSAEKARITEAQGLIERYEAQKNEIKNSREFDNLVKEIEFQNLEIELSKKRIAEHSEDSKLRKERIAALKLAIEERKKDLEVKREELKNIEVESRAEEEGYRKRVAELEEVIEERLILAFRRIREGAKNGLAVVAMEGEACGGCYNKIPPQRQLDVRLHTKIIPCEYCGRIMIDPELAADNN